MYLYGSLFAALVVTLFLVSRIAKMLHAKRPEMGWVFLASLIGGVLASIALVPLNIYVQGLEPMVMLIASIAVVLLTSSAAFKYINKMNWGGAITTNIANVVIGLMTMVAAVVLNGESLQDTISLVTSTAKQNSTMMESVATGELDVQEAIEAAIEPEVIDETLESEEEVIALEDEDLEPKFTERDFLPPSAAKALNTKDAKVYIEPKFRVISVGNINSAVGRKIRILKKNGNTISGSLKSIRGNNAVLSKRIESGEATVPISIAKIQKLEVYR